MAKVTKGTTLYFLQSGTTVTPVGAVVSVSGISASREQIETTSLNDDARTYTAGILSPGKATFEIQFDPSDAGHKALHQLFTSGANVKWALGWSDGTAAPTVTSGSFTLPTTRSFLTFDGIITELPFDFSLNGVVSSSISLQINGTPVLTAKT